MSKLIVNSTKNIGSTVRVNLDGVTRTAVVRRIGPPKLGRDGKLWCMVTAAIEPEGKRGKFGGHEVYFAAMYEGA